MIYSMKWGTYLFAHYALITSLNRAVDNLSIYDVAVMWGG